MATAALRTIIRHLHRLVGTGPAGGLADADLLQRFLSQRDEAAFEVLVWRHGPMVWNVCHRVLHHQHDAEDAFQATFLAFVREAGSINKRTSLSSWLYKVAYRVALKAKTRAAKQARRETLGVDMLPAKPAQPEGFWCDLRPVLDDEVNRLPLKYRLPFVLCYLEGKTTDEAAQDLGCPRGTVATRLAWARERLRTRLTRRGLALSAGVLATSLSQNAASATLPAALVHCTVRTGLLLIAGKAAAEVMSAPVATLAEGVLRSMAIAKLKVVTALVLAAGLAVAGVGLLAHQALVAEPPNAEQEIGPKPVAQGGDQPKPDQETRARTDLNGNPLPAAALARLGVVQSWHGGPVHSTAFSPDGTMLASGSQDHTIRLWDVATGKTFREFRGHQNHVNSVAFSPDGTMLASGSADFTIRLWDVATGRELHRFLGHKGFIHSVAFSPDGKTLASGGGMAGLVRAEFKDNKVRLWEIATRKELRQFSGHGESVRCVAFSPDGQILASGSGDGTIRLWVVATGKERLRIQRHPGCAVVSVAFSPDGKTLASGGAKPIQLWEVATGRELLCFEGSPDTVYSVAFSPNGKTLATGSWDPAMRLWDVATGKELRQFRGHYSEIDAVAFSPDGKTLASGSVDRTVRLWDVATGQERHPIHGHQAAVRCVAFSLDGKVLASGSADRTIRLWDVATWKELRCLRGHQNGVLSLAMAPDGNTLASGDGDIRFWELTTGRELRSIAGQQGWISSLAFSPDGKTLAWKNGGPPIYLCDLSTGKEIRRFGGREIPVFDFAISPDGKLMATGGENSGNVGENWIYLWEVATGKEVGHWKAYQDTLATGNRPVFVAFLPNGRTLLSATKHDSAFELQRADFSLKPPEPVGQDNTPRLWDVATGKEVRRFKGQTDALLCLALSPDGKSFASVGRDHTIRLWEVATGQERHRFRGHESLVVALAFSPDGNTLASGSADATVLVWDATGRLEKGRPPTTNLGPEEWQALWRGLAGADAAKAYRAMGTLTGISQQTVRFFQAQLRPVPSSESPRIAQLLIDLDSDRFSVREKATHELEQLGELAEPALRKALALKPSAEARRRLEQLVEKREKDVLSPAQLQALRAIEVLEHIGSFEARQVLASLAKGAPEAPLTQEAKASLDRLAKRRTTGP